MNFTFYYKFSKFVIVILAVKCCFRQKKQEAMNFFLMLIMLIFFKFFQTVNICQHSSTNVNIFIKKKDKLQQTTTNTLTTINTEYQHLSTYNPKKTITRKEKQQITTTPVQHFTVQRFIYQ